MSTERLLQVQVPTLTSYYVHSTLVERKFGIKWEDVTKLTFNHTSHTLDIETATDTHKLELWDFDEHTEYLDRPAEVYCEVIHEENTND